MKKISQGPVSVSQLAVPLGVTLAAIVQHLKILEQSGIVRTEKTGRVRTCHLESAGLMAAEQWINGVKSIWERRLDRLGELLAETE